MFKRGNKYLRFAAFQATEVAALVAIDPMFKSVYEKQISREKTPDFRQACSQQDAPCCFSGT